MSAIRTREPGAIRAVIFDLDETLLVRSGAWAYALEEAVAAVTGRRIDTRPLAPEYRHRPWRDAAMVVASPPDAAAITELAEQFFRRSAMKRLLVHEGLGMALDGLRGARIETGAVSREPHAVALRQVESTGLDRFLAVLTPTPAGVGWDVTARVRQCLAYLEREAAAAVFVSGDEADLASVKAAGIPCAAALWAGGPAGAAGALAMPADLGRLLQRSS